MMNLLMISVDDLRPMMGCYGYPNLHTPNLDRLATSGVLFENVMCQVPVCGASRASLFTGLRPTLDRFRNHETWAREDAPGVPTLLHLLRDRSYSRHLAGKVFHQTKDYAELWDTQFHSDLEPFPGPYYSDWAINHPERLSGARRGPAYEMVEIPDEAQRDGASAAWLSTRIRELAKRDDGQPWCAALGQIGTHLPFKAPQKYWDLYPPESVILNDFETSPESVPAALRHGWGELRQYAEIPAEGPVSREQALMLTRGYLAGISYVDAQVGKLIEALEETGAWENTAVVLWADHGWCLGEHGMWCKHNLYDVSCHVPMIIRLPECAQAETGIRPGTRVSRVTENLDLYPTLCDLLELPAPGHQQGRSLLPLMRNPQAEWDAYAVSRFYNCESIRTDTWRYVERLEKGEVTEQILFDHRTHHWEDENVAADPANGETLAELAAKLKEIRDRTLAADPVPPR